MERRGTQPRQARYSLLLLLLLQRVERLCRLQSVKIWPARTKGRPSPSRELDYGRATVPRLVLSIRSVPNRMSVRSCVSRAPMGAVACAFSEAVQGYLQVEAETLYAASSTSRTAKLLPRDDKAFSILGSLEGWRGSRSRRTSFSSHPSRAANSDLLIPVSRRAR